MQKWLLTVIVCLLMALATVGVKKIATSASAGSQPVTVADGGAPAPPIPWD
jgi:hypothetical protein